jgi:hypothetical protein
MLLKDWKPRTKPLTYDKLCHDDTTPNGSPSIDQRLIGDKGDDYYAKLGEEIENHPIASAGIRRS